MSATIIDSLIIELGLDPTNFTDGQKKAGESFIRTRDEAEATAKRVESAGKKASSFFTQLRNEAIGLFAAFEGAKGIKDFVVRTTEQSAAVDRLSRKYGISVEELSAWQHVAANAGGTADDVTASILGMVDSFNEFKLTKTSPLLTWFNALNQGQHKFIAGWKTNKAGLLDVSQTIFSITDALGELNKTDPAEARLIAQKLGFGDSLQTLSNLGTDKIKALLKDQEALGSLTKKNTEAAQKLETAWSRFANATEIIGIKLETHLDGILTKTLNVATTLASAVSDPARLKREGNAPGADDKAKADLSSIGTSVSSALFSPEARKQFNGYVDSLMAAKQEGDIRRVAESLGLDPDQAVALAKSEGLGGAYAGDNGSSFGPFQLHVGGIAGGGNSVAGLGDDFRSQTGLDPSDPSTVHEQIVFALRYIKAHGTGQFHGAARVGLPDTIGGQGVAASLSSGGGATVTNETNINSIVVQSNTDNAATVARDIREEIARNSFAQQSNTGPQ